MGTTGFFAYPANSPAISETIRSGIEKVASFDVRLTPWESMRIFGFKLDDLVRDRIADVDVLAADITWPNPNVFYEIGYAAALGKAVIPTLNIAVEGAAQRAQRTGIFDTIGWATYNNSDELADSLRQWPETAWTNSYARQKNHAQPLFILDTLKKTDFRNHIFHAVDNSHLEFRSFDPSQNPRLTATQAIADVSSSSGVIIPLIGEDIVDAHLHNLRASFILGLSHGFNVEALAIQYEHGPAPLDYRDFVTNSTFRKETEGHVEKYAANVLVWNQKSASSGRRASGSLLEEIYLGSPVAENETQTLGEYFVRTAEFSRAVRAEGAVVIGRKGSGKSAIYLQIAEKLSNDKRRCVVDLRSA